MKCHVLLFMTLPSLDIINTIMHSISLFPSIQAMPHIGILVHVDICICICIHIDIKLNIP